MKKAGVKIAAKEAKKIVKAVEKKVEKGKGGKSHQGAKPKKKTPSVASSSMRGQRTYNAPVSVGMSTRSYFQVKNLTSGKYKGGVRVTGRDYFSTATWLTTSPVGTALVNVPLNPSALEGTRLAQFTELYEKYRFNKFKVYACPTASTSTSGAYGMSYDRDPSDATPAAGDPGIREYMSFEGSTTASAWLQSELVAPLMEPTTDYFINAVTGGDERLVDQGQFYLWVYTACSTNTQIALEIEYDLTLYVPQTTGSVGSVELAASTNTSSKKFPQDGFNTAWEPMNTLKVGNTGNWATQVTLGDIAKIVGIPSATLTYGVQVASGLYSVVQALRGLTTTVPSAGTYGFGQPYFVANKAEEQSLFNADQIYYQSGVFDGVTQVVSTSAMDNVFIPPSGGILYGFFDSDSIFYDPLLMQNGANIELVIGPAASSISASGLFTMTLGKPGKFGDEHRRKFNAVKRTRPPRIAKVSSVSVPRPPEALRDPAEVTREARAEALQAAAKLLGIK